MQSQPPAVLPPLGGLAASLRKVRHLSLALLWVRQASLEGVVKIDKVITTRNTSDFLTKVVSKQTMDRLCLLLGLIPLEV